MAKLIDLMRQAGVQWPEGAEYAAQDGDDGLLCFYRERPHVHGWVWRSETLVEYSSVKLPEIAEDWREVVRRSVNQACRTCGGSGVEVSAASEVVDHTDPDYMREQQRLAARNAERRDLVRELMLRHPELTGPQAIRQADEILSTLEGVRDGR